MTTTPSENPNELPLHELSIVPEWTKSAQKSYEHHQGEAADRPRRDRDRGPQRDRGPRRPDRDRPPGAAGRAGPGPQRREGREERPRKPGTGFPPQGPRPPRTGAPPPAEYRPAPPVAAPVEVQFVPDEKGFTAIIEAMKHSHHAYALFDVAKLVLNKPERHLVRVIRKPPAEGRVSALSKAAADGALFLARDEAFRHALLTQEEKLCRQETKPVDPPKGNFTFVNRCGITGVLLGPPNHHEYQTILVRHHQRRLRHMPFEDFRARIQTVKDPEAVKQWMESKSFTTEFHCLACAEPKACATREEFEKHVNEMHAEQLVATAPEFQITGSASRQQPAVSIAEAIRIAWLSERRFPLRTAQVISEGLRQAGFHFFKHGKAVTYVTAIKLKRFDSLDGLSDQVQKIVTFLRAHPDSTRKGLLENLLPTGHTDADVARLASDLHWLVQEGYVVEFSDGKLWALENRPPKPTVAEQPVAVVPSETVAPEPPATPGQPAAPVLIEQPGDSGIA